MLGRPFLEPSKKHHILLQSRGRGRWLVCTVRPLVQPLSCLSTAFSVCRFFKESGREGHDKREDTILLSWADYTPTGVYRTGSEDRK